MTLIESALTESYIAGPTTLAVRDITLGRLLEQAARSAPDRIALISGVPDPALRRQWTYSELHSEAQRTARALRLARPSQDAAALVRGRGVSADRIGKNSEIQAARILGKGRDAGAVMRSTPHSRTIARTVRVRVVFTLAG
jgi:hypothetical protein